MRRPVKEIESELEAFCVNALRPSKTENEGVPETHDLERRTRRPRGPDAAVENKRSLQRFCGTESAKRRITI